MSHRERQGRRNQQRTGGQNRRGPCVRWQCVHSRSCGRYRDRSIVGHWLHSQADGPHCRMEPRPELKPNAIRMWAANGERLKVYGECTMSVELAWTSFRVAVLISYTPGNAFILGTDVMAELGFTIRVGLESVIIEKLETWIPMYQDRRHRCCRIQVAESIAVPPGCEMLVTGSPKGNRWSKSETIGLVEGLGDFRRETGLMVAKAVVDPKKGRICVRVANMRPETVVLRPGTSIALMTHDVNVGEQPM